MDLFNVWRDYYLARLEAELVATRKRMAENDCRLRELAAELRRRNPQLNQFVCKCGEVIADPFDPEQMHIHQPHFIAASLERVHEGLMRWREHARRTMESGNSPHAARND